MWNNYQQRQGPDPRPMQPTDAMPATDGTYNPYATPAGGDMSGANPQGPPNWRKARRQANRANMYDPNAGGAQPDINVTGQPQQAAPVQNATPWMTPLQHPMLNQMQQAAGGFDRRWQQNAPAGTAPLQHNMLNNAQQRASVFDQWRQQVGQLGQQYPQFQQKINDQMQSWKQSLPRPKGA